MLNNPPSLFACGVVRIESSISSASIISSSSSLLLDESDPINILTLPKELDTVVRSGFPIVDQRELGLLCIESELPAKCRPFFLFGMFIALPVIVGELSGLDCSARVELRTEKSVLLAIKVRGSGAESIYSEAKIKLCEYVSRI